MPIAPLPWLSQELPVGTIQIWTDSIASIPVGWAICDGLGGTPNLLAKFIRGVDTSVTEPGALGGADSVALTSATIAAHNHTAVAYMHEHRINSSTALGTGGILYTAGGDEDNQHSTGTRDPPSQNLVATGGGAGHDNLPPYYEVAYIIKQ